MRLVAYQPDGAKIGLLPMPVSFTVSNNLNDVGSLQLAYSNFATKSELLSDYVEISVESSTDTMDWAEQVNCRFVRIDADGDVTDPTGVTTYTLPGYGWLLTKATIVASPAQRVATGKRPFAEQTPGKLLGILINEAHARGNIPGLVADFSATVDSNGDAWRHEAVGLSFDPGTNYFNVLKAMSDAGLVDWRMNGRVLQVFNPMGEMAAPRVSARALVTSETVATNPFLEHVASSASSDPATVFRDATEADRHATNCVSIAQHGYPVGDSFGYHLSTGKDSSTGRPLAFYSFGEDDDGEDRAHGAIACNWSSPGRWFYAVPNANSTTRPDLLAKDAWQRNSGHMVLAESTSSVKAGDSLTSGYSLIGRKLIQRGLMCVEIVSFSQSEYPGYNVIVQGGAQNGVSTLVTGLQQRFQSIKHGIIVHPDYGNLRIPSAQRPDDLRYDSALAIQARKSGIRYARIGVSDGVLANSALVAYLGEALNDCLDSLPRGRYLAFTSAKRAVDPDDPTQLSGVDLRLGRDLTQAPTKRSLTEMCGRVYAYGDAWSQVVLTNTAADNPWGIWEMAISQGGVDDTDDLEKLASTALDNGAAEKVSFTRGVTYMAAKFLPGFDYDVGDYVMSDLTPGQLIPMRIYQSTITRDDTGLSGSLVMGDRFLPSEIKQSRAVVAASGGAVGGTVTGGAGVRVAAVVTETRKAAKAVIS